MAAAAEVAVPPTANASIGGSGSTPLQTPVSTLYCSNIDWKIKKNVLRRSLHALFSRHGKILEIVTLRKDGLRGQAWVIFEEVAAASAALNAEDGFAFFNRPLKVSYAREKSDRVAKMDGSFVPKDRKEKHRKREAEDVVGSGAVKQAKLEVGVDDPSALVDVDRVARAETGARVHVEGSDESALPPPPPPPPPPPVAPVVEALPSKILFAQDLPPECNEMMLAMLFRQHVGYKETRIPRPGLAFIEFESEPHATLALKALNGFKLTTTETLKLTYGKS